MINLMPLYVLTHTSLIILTIGIIHTWTASVQASQYNLQLAGILAIIYFFTKFLKPKPKILSIITTLTFLSLTLLIIFSTGRLDSPFFFLLDILLFALALFFEPIQATITSVTLILVFLISSKLSLNTSQVINLASLVLITPLAVVFGNKFLENQAIKGKITRLEKDLATEETHTLLWISTKAKPSLVDILNITSQIISSNLLSFRLQEQIKKAHKDLLSLHKSANELETIIDQED
jgi:hypothetical protein